MQSFFSNRKCFFGTAADCQLFTENRNKLISTQEENCIKEDKKGFTIQTHTHRQEVRGASYLNRPKETCARACVCL